MADYFTHAITRKPGENFAQGLTTSNLGMPDYHLILKQHNAYVESLISIGLDVTVLDPQPEFPDSHFVEDTAVVTPDIAVITRPGAATRQGEGDTIAPVLARYRRTAYIQPPGTLDGGDVLMVSKHFFIGISERTNRYGAEQLGKILEDYGNTWETVAVGERLHFKSSVNYVGKDTLLVAEEFAGLDALKDYTQIIVDGTEVYAANTLWVNDRLLIPKGFPKTKKKLESLELEIIELDVSEMRKMDGGLTCLSIRF